MESLSSLADLELILLDLESLADEALFLAVGNDGFVPPPPPPLDIILMLSLALAFLAAAAVLLAVLMANLSLLFALSFLSLLFLAVPP